MYVERIKKNKRKMKAALSKAIDEMFDQLSYNEKSAVAQFGRDDINYDIGDFSAKILIKVLPHEPTGSKGFEMHCNPTFDFTPADK